MTPSLELEPERELELDRGTLEALDRTLLRDRRLGDLAWLRHGISSRSAVLGRGEGNVGYGPPRDRAMAWRSREAWAAVIDVPSDRLVGIRQIHGAEVVAVDETFAGRGARPGSMAAGEADALITNVPGLPLMTLHADCQPIILVDPVRRSVGVAHAGWRGVVTDVAGATVGALGTHFNSQPQDLLAFLGPAIGVECYEVGAEVINAWRHAYCGHDGETAVEARKPKAHFNLTRANRLLLRRAGLTDEHIQCSGICTRCQGGDWFSHRGQGAASGRFAAIVAIAGDGAM